MSATLPKVGDLGIDYSRYRLTQPQRARDAKYKFIFRYSSGAASDPSHPSHSIVAAKLITPSEFKRLVAWGFDIVPNDEWYQSRVTEGYAAGVQDATAAAKLWAACGLAKGASIYVSWDTGPKRGDMPKVREYLKGYQSVLDKYGYFVDLYGGDPAIRRFQKLGLIRYGWRAMADSWSGSERFYRTISKLKRLMGLSPAHIWQDGNVSFDGNADDNVVLKTPIGSHFEALLGQAKPPAPKPPAPKPPAPKPPVPTPHYIEGYVLRQNGKIVWQSEEAAA